MPTLAGLLRQETKENKAERFYSALGRFVCSFADAEVSMYILLFHFLRVKIWKARALVGGHNMGGLVSLAKRIAPKCLGPQKVKDLNVLLTQLEVINQFRHDLIHRGADISEKEIRSSNFFSAKTSEAIEEMVLEVDHVLSATADLGRIRTRIYCLVLPKEMGRMTKARRNELFAPWQCIPPARQSMEKRFLLEALEREHQPRSSDQ